MQRTYKFRLYPTKVHEQKLLWTLNKCRFVYNKLLEKKNNGKINKNELQNSIVEIKEQYPELKGVHSKVLQYENYRLFSNLHALSQLKKKGKAIGKLRFKGRNWFKTFSYNQSGFQIIDNETRYDKLHLSKIGDIPFIKHREIEGMIKQVTVKRYSSGKWYVSVICEINDAVKPVQNDKKVGVDLGTLNYVYDSNGNHFDNPKSLKKSEDKLAKEQRELSRKKRGSKNKIKQKRKVARVYEKITNQRDDFLHKLSRNYVNSYGFIAVEDLQIKNMLQNHHLAESISDASWSKFLLMLEYKAENAGVRVVKVNPQNTSQICSKCGNIVKKELWNRIHKCNCGLEIDRDYNSAINILNRATVGTTGSNACGDVLIGTSGKQEAITSIQQS